jgi:molybdopterin converting factor small subunit
MKVRVELQAYLEKFSPNGAPRFELELPDGATVDRLLRELAIPDDETQVIIVNNESVDFERRLQDGDEVILIPPLAGG